MKPDSSESLQSTGAQNDDSDADRKRPHETRTPPISNKETDKTTAEHRRWETLPSQPNACDDNRQHKEDSSHLLLEELKQRRWETSQPNSRDQGTEESSHPSQPNAPDDNQNDNNSKIEQEGSSHPLLDQLKRERRLAMNRSSARERRIKYEQDVKVLEQQCADLSELIATFQEQNEALRAYLSMQLSQLTQAQATIQSLSSSRQQTGFIPHNGIQLDEFSRIQEMDRLDQAISQLQDGRAALLAAPLQNASAQSTAFSSHARDHPGSSSQGVRLHAAALHQRDAANTVSQGAVAAVLNNAPFILQRPAFVHPHESIPSQLHNPSLSLSASTFIPTGIPMAAAAPLLGNLPPSRILVGTNNPLDGRTQADFQDTSSDAVRLRARGRKRQRHSSSSDLDSSDLDMI